MVYGDFDTTCVAQDRSRDPLGVTSKGFMAALLHHRYRVNMFLVSSAGVSNNVRALWLKVGKVCKRICSAAFNQLGLFCTASVLSYS